MESTLIIGNGFDLDLGIKTSYKDFRKSEFWPIQSVLSIDTSLKYFLFDSTLTNSWFDLEDLLYVYASKANRSKYEAEIDKKFFQLLSDKLCEFIKLQENGEIKSDSLASSFFPNFNVFDNIFSFNYTDLRKLSKNAGSSYPIKNYIHVHGTCVNDSSILGIGDNYKINKLYYFLYKTSNPYYKSSNVRYALQRSKLVVFYGHSLGPQDYHYFSNFFKCQSLENMVEDDKKIIVFITKNKESRDGILYQLREMNDGKIDLLYDCNDIRWIYTVDDITYNLKELSDVFKTLSFLKDKQILKRIAERSLISTK